MVSSRIVQDIIKFFQRARSSRKPEGFAAPSWALEMVINFIGMAVKKKRGGVRTRAPSNMAHLLHPAILSLKEFFILPSPLCRKLALPCYWLACDEKSTWKLG
jgi:hypothetical protein